MDTHTTQPCPPAPEPDPGLVYALLSSHTIDGAPVRVVPRTSEQRKRLKEPGRRRLRLYATKAQPASPAFTGFSNIRLSNFVAVAEHADVVSVYECPS
jgi:hypothetical protein